MEHALVHGKSLRQNSSLAQHRPVTGPSGVSIAPPAYGIDFVDRQQSTDVGMTVQCQASEASPTAEGQQENRTGLPDDLKAGIETLSDFSLDDVRVHYNSAKPAALQALAYTQGTDIHVAPGQERHLPHEVWHVVQQKQGRVKPTFQLKGEQVNDDDRLEHEADILGVKAMQMRRPDNTRIGAGAGAAMAVQRAGETGDVLDVQGEAIKTLGGKVRFNFLSTQHRVSDRVVQRQAIKSAGLELELKGALLTKGFDEEERDYGSHEKVIDKGDWWIEVDARHLELVTEPTESRAELLGWLKLGHAVLKDIQLLAELADSGTGNESSPENIKLMDQIADRSNLPMDAHTYLNAEEGKYLAKPQISFGIKKGQLSNFFSSVMGPKIKYTEGYTRQGKKYENTRWPRVNTEVQKIYTSSPIWQNKKGLAFLKKLSTASTEAKGLSLMTIITILFAMRKQDENDIWQYYKGRFSVMPRVPLSDLYDALEGPMKKEYKALMTLWFQAVQLNNKDKEESNEGYHPTKIYRAQKDLSTTIERELRSIVHPSERTEKTLKDKNKQVDVISSDEMATTRNVGASVGALDLPDESDGVYEIRSLPFTNIQDYTKVEKIYVETIDAYGGMG